MTTSFPPGPSQGPQQGPPYPGPVPQGPPPGAHGHPFGPGPQGPAPGGPTTPFPTAPFPTGQVPPGPFSAGQVPPGQVPPGQVPPGQGGPGAPGWQGHPPMGGEPPSSATSPASIRRIAQILCPILVIAGLSIPQGGSVGWADYTLWALFAAAMSLVQLITLGSTRSPGQSAVVVTIATGALIAYWVVIVLPGISSNGGFLQTLGVGCAAVAAWLGSGRR